MSLETFHRFPNLPGELRKEIWRFAVCFDGLARSGAHFFGVVSPREVGTAELASHALVLRDSTFDRKICLVGPLWEWMSAEREFIDKPEPASWIDNNPSTYLVNSGLWMACKESRYAIDQVFHRPQQDGTRSNRFRRMPLAYQNEADMPDDAKDRFITVFPGHDLFCFQAYDWGTLDRERIPGGIPFLLNTFGGVRNMAIEYDSTWGIEVNHPGYNEWGMILEHLSNILAEVIGRPGVRKLFLIDYRIKRRHHVPTKEQTEKGAGQIFYHQGRRFTDVKFHRQDSMWQQEYEVAEDEMCSNMFVRDLQEVARVLVRGRSSNPEEDRRIIPYFGILACEED